MIKRIIFDLDGTLLNTRSDNLRAFKKICLKYKFDHSAEELYNNIELFKFMPGFSKMDFYKGLKDFLGDNFTEKVFEEFIDMLRNEATLIYSNTEEVLKYLNNKYDVTVLTNWFYDYQIGKLKQLDLLNYFSEIHACDKIGLKPMKETFEKACFPYSFEECVIVGDSLDTDIIYPDKLGIKVIYVGESSEYTSINSIEDLQNIL